MKPVASFAGEISFVLSLSQLAIGVCSAFEIDQERKECGPCLFRMCPCRRKTNYAIPSPATSCFGNEKGCYEGSR